MIVFDLKCRTDHVFEAWFASSDAYEKQVSAGHVRCPICDDPDVHKAPMAPGIPAKGNSKPPAAGRDTMPTPDTLKSALKTLAARQAKILESSQWVGPAFADRARAMHLGEEKQAMIHGQTSLAEAKALAEEGVPVATLPLPVIPPEQAN